jgi:hypothetical protein
MVVTRDFLEQVSAIGASLATSLTSECGSQAFGRDAACTRTSIARALPTVFRGLEDPEDLATLTALALEIGGRSGSTAAADVVSRAIALSPKSLYLFEGLGQPEATGSRRLTAAELASFLSYRLTHAPPPPVLRAALAANAAPSEAELRAMVTDAFGEATIDRAAQDFLSTWLELPDADRSNKDLGRHPTATTSYLRSLMTEDFATLGTLVARDRTFAQLLTEPLTSIVANDARPAASGVVRVGVFSLPSVMAGASGMAETNIPRRGRFLLRRMLCESLVAPPANAVTMAPGVPPGSSQRVRFAAVEQLRSCAGCHLRLDPLAIPLEVIDEIGTLRSVDEHGNSIDPSGTMEWQGRSISYADAKDLWSQLASDPKVTACFGAQALNHFARLNESPPQSPCTGHASAPLDSARLTTRRAALDALMRAALAPRLDLPGASP